MKMARKGSKLSVLRLRTPRAVRRELHPAGRGTLTCGYVAQLVLLIATLRAGESTARATVVATLSNTTATPHSVLVAAGGSFDVGVHLDTGGVSLLAASVQLADLSASGLFQLSSASFSAPWSIAVDDVLDPSPQLLGSPSYTSSDIGSLAADLNAGTGASADLLLASLHLGVSAAASPGTYQLNLANVVAGNLDGDRLDTQTGSNFSVVIVPEPATWMGMVLCVLVLGIRPPVRQGEGGRM